MCPAGSPAVTAALVPCRRSPSRCLFRTLVARRLCRMWSSICGCRRHSRATPQRSSCRTSRPTQTTLRLFHSRSCRGRPAWHRALRPRCARRTQRGVEATCARRSSTSRCRWRSSARRPPRARAPRSASPSAAAAHRLRCRRSLTTCSHARRPTSPRRSRQPAAASTPSRYATFRAPRSPSSCPRRAGGTACRARRLRPCGCLWRSCRGGLASTTLRRAMHHRRATC
mmetsp:Transcript_38529/g.114327  ORF Transcript_38529/g.114327 Transcript_38529/m.114327 type:complete len:227 (+) Transcript_38529:2523-3203(+)